MKNLKIFLFLQIICFFTPLWSMEDSITSIRRKKKLKEYDKIPSSQETENDEESGPQQPPSDWPQACKLIGKRGEAFRKLHVLTTQEGLAQYIQSQPLKERFLPKQMPRKNFSEKVDKWLKALAPGDLSAHEDIQLLYDSCENVRVGQIPVGNALTDELFYERFLWPNNEENYLDNKIIDGCGMWNMDQALQLGTIVNGGENSEIRNRYRYFLAMIQHNMRKKIIPGFDPKAIGYQMMAIGGMLSYLGDKQRAAKKFLKTIRGFIDEDESDEFTEEKERDKSDQFPLVEVAQRAIVWDVNDQLKLLNMLKTNYECNNSDIIQNIGNVENLVRLNKETSKEISKTIKTSLIMGVLGIGIFFGSVLL